MLRNMNEETFGERDFNEGGYTNGAYLLFDEITLESAKDVCEWILTMNTTQKPPEILNLFICSEGGDLQAAFAIIDMIKGSSIPVRTIGIGVVSSAGLLIFMSGKKGERFLTPNTSILSHRFSGGSVGKSHELLAITKEFVLTEKRMVKHYISCTGLSEKKVREILLPHEDVFLDADEALKLGLCDKIKDLS